MADSGAGEERGERSSGPLAGLRVLEIEAIGPVPLAGMILADMGAQVVRVDRVQDAGASAEGPYMARGKRSIALDLKSEGGREVVMRLVDRSDILIEGFRPGVMERLGLGPDVCLGRNPRLVYGRMTGWGQQGPLRLLAGHDINYISLTGALGAIGTAERPIVPLNLVGDFGGGSMFLLAGVLAALHEQRSSGRGQVVDAAMVDGASLLATLMHELAAEGRWSSARASNLLDGGRPYYDVYETADRQHVAVGALEPQFFAELVRVLGIDFDLEEQHDPAAWPRLRNLLETSFRARTREEWAAAFAGVDACVTPVLALEEASSHHQARERAAFVTVDGKSGPAPAPRFSRTAATAGPRAPTPGADTREILAELSLGIGEVEQLLASNAAFQNPDEQRS